MSFIDRQIARVSPRWAAERARARVQHMAAEMAGEQAAEIMASGRHALSEGVPDTRWRGASRSLRSLVSWQVPRGGAYRNLPGYELDRMAGRSQDAARNHTIARAVLGRMRTGIVGTGVRPHAVVDADALGIPDVEADRINMRLDDAFAEWAEEPAECDIAGEFDFYAKQDQAVLASMIDGDMFVSTPMVTRPGRQWSMKTQEIGGWRVSNPDGQADTAELIMGIDRTRDGYQRGVWVRRADPDDVLNPIDAYQWDRLPVWGERTGRRRVMHVRWDVDQLGAVRAAPALAPILEPIQQLETYKRSELMAAVVTSLFTVFLKKDGAAGSQLDDNLDPMAAFAGSTTVKESQRDSAASQFLELGSGSILDLAPGEEPVAVSPNRPNKDFDQFFRSIIDAMGSAIGIPGDILLMRYNASYAAARAAMLEAYRTFTKRRRWLVQSHSAPIRALVIDEAVARGRLVLPGYADPLRRRAYLNALWIGPARGSMDEDKEANAAGKRIKFGISNEWMETAAMSGENWLQVHQGRRRALFYKRRDGIFPPGDAETTAAAPAPAAADDPEPAPDDTSEGATDE